MVTVAIMGIVMAAGIVAFSNAQKVARDAKRRADVDAMGKALEIYYTDTGGQRYVNPGSWIYGATSNSASWNNAPMAATFNQYFPSGLAPVDPVNSASLNYGFYALLNDIPGAVNPKSRFCVYTNLERANGNCTGITNTNWGGDPNSFQCNFVTPGTGTRYCVQNLQ